MKTLTPALKAHLESGGPFIMADLYTITLTNGTVLRWADFDVDVTHPVSGEVYSSDCPVLRRGTTRIVLGVEVDTLDVSIYPRADDVVGGVRILPLAVSGAFDKARLRLERAFLAEDLSCIGTVIMFSGRFADITIGRSEIVARVNSGTEVFNIMLPRNLYQAGCTNVLYDDACGVPRAVYGVASTVSSGSTASEIICALSHDSGWFARGYVRFISGALTGETRSVKSSAPGVLRFISPLAAVPSVGDAFIAYPGCDKLFSTCQSKFGNGEKFRGCPFIPVPETAV